MNIDNFLIENNLNDSFDILHVFETRLSEFFGSPYAVLTDCCTHAIELCLRLEPDSLVIPKQTNVSIPITAIKLNLHFEFHNVEWTEFYQLKPNLYDAATLWRKNSYIPGSRMCISFQHKKHINIGRGGCILLDDLGQYQTLKKMRYDGRNLDFKHHAKDNIDTIGYHYYMTPESALQGIEIFEKKKNMQPKIWTDQDYVDLSKLDVFKHYV